MPLFTLATCLNYVILLVFAIRISQLKKDSFVWYLLSVVAASFAFYTLVPDQPITSYLSIFWIHYIISIIGIISFYLLKDKPKKALSKYSIMTFSIIFIAMLFFSYNYSFSDFESHLDFIIAIEFFILIQLSILGLIMLSQKYIFGYLCYGLGLIPTIYFGLDDLTHGFDINTIIRVTFSFLVFIVVLIAYFANRKTK
ncbi:hypothetical protein AB4F11_01455 [Francisella philomiragia]